MIDVWEIIHRELESPFRRSRHAMGRLVTECWEMLRIRQDKDFYIDLYAGMNGRIQNVIDRHGAYIDR